MKTDHARGERGGHAHAGMKRCRTIRGRSWLDLEVAGLDLVSVGFSSPREAVVGPWA